MKTGKYEISDKEIEEILNDKTHKEKRLNSLCEKKIHRELIKFVTCKLIKTGKLTVRDISNHFGFSMQIARRKLGILKTFDLIKKTKERGRILFYEGARDEKGELKIVECYEKTKEAEKMEEEFEKMERY